VPEATAAIDVEVEEPVQPLGNVHVYELAPLTDEMEYVLEELRQTEVFPEIVPGCAGTLETPTAKVCAGEVPQELLAVTDIVPPVEPTVAVIELVVEVPDQPLYRK
jgi:hypothetical protein